MDVTEHRTRERVLAAVSERGPVTAAELGRLLGLTPAAVRRHLDALTDDGSVLARERTTGGRGRPARAYVVSDAGHEALSADYDGLAADALRFLERTAGAEAVTGFARERAETLVSRYAAPVAAAGSDPADRAQALVAALSADGFAASARPVGAGIQLCQGHCPVKHVAEQFPAFCDAETDAFSRLLGVHVQRLATLAAGAHVCTTFVPAIPHPSASTHTAPTTERSSR